MELKQWGGGSCRRLNGLSAQRMTCGARGLYTAQHCSPTCPLSTVDGPLALCLDHGEAQTHIKAIASLEDPYGYITTLKEIKDTLAPGV